MLASNPAAILDQIFGRAGIALTQESTQDDHALSRTRASGPNYCASFVFSVEIDPV
jgi:hypothetical protein